MTTGEIAQGRAHFDQAVALYNPIVHRPLATLFEADDRVSTLCFRSLALWILGYPEAALADANQALRDARQIGQAATLQHALNISVFPLIHCGNYVAANVQLDEAVALAEEKGALHWGAEGRVLQGCVFSLTGKVSNAIEMIASGITAIRSGGGTLRTAEYLSYLAKAAAEIGQFDDAERYIGDAMKLVETTDERWYEAEINRIAGIIALMSPKPDAAKAQAYFELALAVARQQQAKSWELRAAMSLARLGRSQGKPQQAREQLAPVYA